MNYHDYKQHHATVQEHINAITADLKDFTKNNTADDVATMWDLVQNIGGVLGVLYDAPRDKMATVIYTDFAYYKVIFIKK